MLFSAALPALVAVMRLLYCTDRLPKDKQHLNRLIKRCIIATVVSCILIGQLASWPVLPMLDLCMSDSYTPSVNVWAEAYIAYGIFMGICLMVLTVSYVLLALNVRNRQIESSSVRKDIVTLKTLCIMAVVFLLSFMTPHGVFLVATKAKCQYSQRIAYGFFRSFMFIQSALNPIILYCTNASYRDHVQINVRELLAKLIPNRKIVPNGDDIDLDAQSMSNMVCETTEQRNFVYAKIHSSTLSDSKQQSPSILDSRRSALGKPQLTSHNVAWDSNSSLVDVHIS